MDPNANLEEQRQITNRIISADGTYGETRTERLDILRLAELGRALDEWLAAGGFQPKEWQDEW